MVYIVLSGYLGLEYFYIIESLSVFDTLESVHAYICDKIEHEVPYEECDIGTYENLDLGPGWVIIPPGSYRKERYFIVKRN